MKNKKFIPPTKEEVEKFATDNGFPAQLGARAWQHYEDGNWHDTSGKQVVGWRQKVRTNWFNKYEDDNNAGNKRFIKPKTGAAVYAERLSRLSGKY